MTTRVLVSFWFEFPGDPPNSSIVEDALNNTTGIEEICDQLQDMVYDGLAERPEGGCAGLWGVTVDKI